MGTIAYSALKAFKAGLDFPSSSRHGDPGSFVHAHGRVYVHGSGNLRKEELGAKRNEP